MEFQDLRLIKANGYNKLDVNKLQNKVILLTGASSGIGEATAYELAKHKVNLILTARREEKLREVAKQIEGKVKSVEVIPCDLTKTKEIDTLIDQTIEKFGRIDVLINNAGWGAYGWIEDLTLEDIKGQYSVNIVAMAYLCHKVVPFMQAQRSGHIINMSSYASRIAVPPMSIYASTKYAVEGFSDALRRELDPWGIKVTRIHPGSVAGTEFNQKARARGGAEYKFAGIARISREKMAREIVKILIDPQRELLISKLYEFPAFFNRHFPGLVDFFMSTWVGWQRRAEMKQVSK